MFSLKDLGSLHFFLGIQVVPTIDGLHLSQTQYIANLLKRAKMDQSNPSPTPMITGSPLSATRGDPIENATEYRSLVGGLQYATITRPEISYSVNKLSQYMHCPLNEHWKALKRVLRYLKGTITHGLDFTRSKSLNLTAYSDSDWATDVDDRRSTSGFCIFLGNNLVTWSSKKQPTLSRSSTEAEYRSLASATAEILWLNSLLQELRIQQSRTPIIWCDNLSTVSLSANPVLHSRTKHIELDLFFVREKVVNKDLSVCHIPSIDQVADILTKPLSGAFFGRLKNKLRVVPLDTLELRGNVKNQMTCRMEDTTAITNNSQGIVERHRLVKQPSDSRR